jgi:hypothetical protein
MLSPVREAGAARTGAPRQASFPLEVTTPKNMAEVHRKGGVLARAKRYFDGVLHLELCPHALTWNRLQELQTLRNVITPTTSL